MGTVYLIHFDTPYLAKTGRRFHKVQHYIGYTGNLKKRLREHRLGYGARLLEILALEGIDWIVVRTWEGDRKLEIRLKGWHKSSGLCPVCKEAQKVKRLQDKLQGRLF